MRFAERGLYVEAYIKCLNCGELVYDDPGPAPARSPGAAAPVYCSEWCRRWAAEREARRATDSG